MPQSKPFVIATEGPTIDGRTIRRDWIEQMAKNYSTKVYTAVANLEHYLSSLPDGIFKAYGKVVSLATQETEILGKKKLQLMAVVDASQDIVDLQKKGQKAFASMEVGQIDSDTFYLTGLAFTDTPASLGTETMKFSIAGMPGERYAFQNEIALEFEAENETETDKPTAGATLFAKVKELLGLGKKEADARFADQALAIEAIATSQKELLDQFSGSAELIAGELKDGKAFATADDLKALQDAQAKLTADFTALQTKLGTTDADDKGRPPAAGGNAQQVKTDC